MGEERSGFHSICHSGLANRFKEEVKRKGKKRGLADKVLKGGES